MHYTHTLMTIILDCNFPPASYLFPLISRLLFSCLLLRRLHGEYFNWRLQEEGGSAGAGDGPQHGNGNQHGPLTAAASFVFQEAVFEWLDTRQDGMLFSRETADEEAGNGKPKDDDPERALEEQMSSRWIDVNALLPFVC